MDRTHIIIRPSKAWFAPCCMSVLLSALFFLGNLFTWDGPFPAASNFYGAIFGNFIGLLCLIRFEFVDYGRRSSGTYDDWRWQARLVARYVTLVGWSLGVIHTIYFVTEWSRYW